MPRVEEEPLSDDEKVVNSIRNNFYTLMNKMDVYRELTGAIGVDGVSDLVDGCVGIVKKWMNKPLNESGRSAIFDATIKRAKADTK